MYNRRTLLQVLLSGAYCAVRQLRGAPRLAEDEPRAMLRGFRCSARFEVRYRVDATVTLLGIPLFTKSGVGSGYAAAEIGHRASENAVALQFAAGSWPAQCRGLNRFGVLQEAYLDGPAKAVVFAGLITPSKEDDIKDAEKALRPPDGQMDITVARGFSTDGRIRFQVGKTTIPSRCDWTNAAQMLDTVAPENTAPRELPLENSTTFMAAMRDAALNGEASLGRPFVHNGKQFVLETKRRTGASPELFGMIRTSSGAKAAEFRTFYSKGDESGLPERIEYRAKSYLRLTFVADPGVVQPAIPTLFSEEVL